jgi:predicted TPR repeat methyltransferase
MGNDGERDRADDDWLLRGSADVDEITQYYDDWAERYDGDLDEWSYEAPDTASRMLLAHGAGDRVLDAGCGTGLVGRALRRGGYDGRLVGVDVSAASLEQAAEAGVYTSIQVGDLQRPLEFDDDAFSGLICVGVMTYVPQVDAAWREFARVVAPGGVVVVTQREDLWDERGCRSVVDAMAAAGVWTPIEVSDARPYLPGNDEFADEIGVYYVVARVS